MAAEMVEDEQQERKDKLRTVEDAIREIVPNPCPVLAIGGMHQQNAPMTLIRELIRQRVRIGRLITSPSASINADLLIGAGLVDEIVTSYVGFEYLGLAPAFRRAVEGGTIRLIEADAPLIVYGLQAAAAGQPFATLPAGLEMSDVHRAAPDFYKWTTDPFTGQPTLCVPALRPTVALIHCQQADPFGNSIFRGSLFTDKLMAMAAERTVVQVENVVRTSSLYSMATQVGIPAALVSAVVEQAFGNHPCASHRYYNHDEPHLKDYVKKGMTEAGMQEYLQRYVFEPDSHEDYMFRVRTDTPDSFTSPSL